MVRPLYQHLREFLSAGERGDVLTEIAAHQGDQRRIDGKAGLGPRYSVIGGDVIASSMPYVAGVGRRAQELVAQYASAPVVPFAEPRRRARVQTYDHHDDGFRWHLDGHPFVALVTLENESDGVTEIISPGLTKIVKPFFYLAYPVPQVFSALPRTAVAAGAGDALIFNGKGSLHRGRSRSAGRRTILVFAFDLPGARPSRLRSWFARFVNY